MNKKNREVWTRYKLEILPVKIGVNFKLRLNSFLCEKIRFSLFW